MAKMLGKLCHEGPGGRSCHCCNVPPGKHRRQRRRNIKRGKKNYWGWYS